MQLSEYPLQEKVNAFVEKLEVLPVTGTTKIDKDFYLDLSEKIVCPALKWQNSDGQIIDPFEGYSVPMATARFVGACAGLILGGRGDEKIINACISGMNAACKTVSISTEKYIIGSPAFYVKELMLGFKALKGKVDKKKLSLWIKQLNSYKLDIAAVSMRHEFDKQPEWHSRQIPGNGLTFLIAGEMMKKFYGMADNSEWIEKQMPYLPQKFTEFGMWRDSGDPMTYDWVPRMNLSLALLYGYNGNYKNEIDEYLRRGALTMLFYLSTSGEAPYGGRSSQNNHNEVTIALICEYEANRYAKLGKTKLAGAFKRAAHKALLSIKRFIDMKPFRNTKNSFPPEKEHGREASYGFYSVYSLLTASQLGITYTLANDEIEEAPLPQEICGYAFELPGAFHKVFASCGDYHIEIDTNASFTYDATGLGRIHRKEFPSELGISTSIVSHGNFLPLPPASERNICIGPGWVDNAGKKYWLSEFWEQIEKTETKILKEDTASVEFSISYTMKNEKWGCRVIKEHYQLTNTGLIINSSIEGNVSGIIFQVPLMKFNGKNKGIIRSSESSFKVQSMNSEYNVKCLSSNVKSIIEPFMASNRNADYQIGCFMSENNNITIKLSIEK
ncbi:MAG: Conserved hypothetical membrane protein [Candidatus Uhrbacteria bacterium GW2011_GWF2_39_13]|uniref:Conserved hypothetical membrane protein n=1 Tax=Candidatus Uhrbacteria bacterium GW2011_GWF2_39_13 TaxID=1618995 RepID=A0A0G0MNM1_9BACT|nr:MAG: Conserved hypothetical membrane protein [Candidatus Uhrbacteria bacterium GW2011_GWF2_39_13]